MKTYQPSFILLSLTAIAMLLVTSQSGYSQAAGKKKVEPVTLKFLPVGEPPTSEVVVDEKLGSIEKEVDKSLLPPQQLHVLKPPLPGTTRKEYAAARLSIGVLSLPVTTVPKGGAIGLFLRSEVNGKETYKPWASVKLPSGSKRGILMLNKAPGKQTWEKPTLTYFQTDESEFPAGSIRAINVTKSPAILEVNGSKHNLKPGASKVVKGDSDGEALRYRVSIGTSRKAVQIANTALRLGATGTATLVVLPEEKPNARRPARVKVYREG